MRDLGDWWQHHDVQVLERRVGRFTRVASPTLLEHSAPHPTHVLVHGQLITTAGWLRPDPALPPVRVAPA